MFMSNIASVMLTFFSDSLPLEAGGKKDGTYLKKKILLLRNILLPENREFFMCKFNATVKHLTEKM